MFSLLIKRYLCVYRDNIDYANLSNACREIHTDFALETGTKKLRSTKLIWLYFMDLTIKLKPLRSLRTSVEKNRKRVKSKKKQIGFHLNAEPSGKNSFQLYGHLL